MEFVKQNWKRYLESSLVTFFTFFLPMVAFELNSRSYDDLLVAGKVGVGAMLLRLAGKAIYEALKAKLPILIQKLPRLRK